MKNNIFLFILFLNVFSNIHGARVRFISILNCKSSNLKGMSFEVCKVGSKGLNVSFEISIPTNKINVQLDVLMKKDGEFKKLLKTPVVEWCSHVKKLKKETNRFRRAFWDILKETAPDLFKKCPYKARFEGGNLNIPSNQISFLPLTEYKILIEAFLFPPNNANVTFGLHVELYE